jgi:hypothetical protein
MRSCARVFSLMAISLALAAVTLSAQAPEGATAHDPGRFIAFASRLSTSSHLISRAVCPGPELSLEARGGIRTHRWLGFAISAAYSREILVESCVNGLHPPPPDSGTVVGTGYPGVDGYPYASLGVLGVLDQVTDESANARLHAGVEWIPAKEIFGLLLGGDLVAGSIGDNASIDLGVEARSLRIPKEITTVEFRQGQPISIERQRSAIWQVRWGVRLGVEVLVWRRE